MKRFFNIALVLAVILAVAGIGWVVLHGLGAILGVFRDNPWLFVAVLLPFYWVERFHLFGGKCDCDKQQHNESSEA